MSSDNHIIYENTAWGVQNSWLLVGGYEGPCLWYTFLRMLRSKEPKMVFGTKEPQLDGGLTSAMVIILQ